MAFSLKLKNHPFDLLWKKKGWGVGGWGGVVSIDGPYTELPKM